LLNDADSSAFAGLPALTEYKTFFCIKSQFDLRSFVVQRLCYTCLRIFERFLDLACYQLLTRGVVAVRAYIKTLHCSAKSGDSIVVACAISEDCVKSKTYGDSTAEYSHPVGYEEIFRVVGVDEGGGECGHICGDLRALTRDVRI